MCSFPTEARVSVSIRLFLKKIRALNYSPVITLIYILFLWITTNYPVIQFFFFPILAYSMFVCDFFIIFARHFFYPFVHKEAMGLDFIHKSTNHCFCYVCNSQYFCRVLCPSIYIRWYFRFSFSIFLPSSIFT